MKNPTVMKNPATRLLSAEDRRRFAREALQALGRDRREHVRLRVRCGCSHHVAAVYETARGLVYVSVIGARSHGDRDFVDAPHNDQEHGREHVDLLAVDNDLLADDELSAGCECGPRTLSRTRLLRAVTDGERRLQVP